MASRTKIDVSSATKSQQQVINRALMLAAALRANDLEGITLRHKLEVEVETSVRRDGIKGFRSAIEEARKSRACQPRDRDILSLALKLATPVARELKRRAKEGKPYRDAMSRQAGQSITGTTPGYVRPGTGRGARRAK